MGPPPTSGMTSHFFFDFFPALWRLLSTRFPTLWAALQPSHILGACRELRAVVPALCALRNPTLLPLQLLGAAVGLEGAWRLLGQRSPQAACWGFSFLFFALMNTSSIAAHTLLARHTLAWQYASALDVAMTGSASLCMLYQHAAGGGQLAAALRRRLQRPLQPPCTVSGAWRVCLGTAAITLALALAGHLWLQLPWVNELLYLGTTAIAAAVSAEAYWSTRRAASAGRRRFYWVALLGVLLMLAALPLDRFLCAALGPAFGTVHMLFLGSDLAFWGLYGYVTGHALGSPHAPPAKQE